MIENTRINACAAIGLRNELGVCGDLCFKLKKDMQWFKSLTAGAVLIMGHETFKSLNYRILPGRRHIVITKDQGKSFNQALLSNGSLAGHSALMDEVEKEESKLNDVNGIELFWVSDMQQIKDVLNQLKVSTAWVVGGAMVYKMMLAYCDKLYLNYVQEFCPKATVFFPENIGPNWAIESQMKVQDVDEQGNSVQTFQTVLVQLDGVGV